MENYSEELKELLSIEIPHSLKNNICFLFLDENEKNVTIQNVTYYFKNGPLECPFYPNYFYIPKFSRYVINRLGEILLVKTGKAVKWVKTSASKESIRGGYVTTSIYEDSGKRKGLTRHRALALTFLKYNKHPSNFVVNHLNGIGGDDRIENIEFCSYSQNTKHAYDNNLYPNKTVSIDVLNWKTGFQKSYPSIQKCVEELNIPHTLICYRLSTSNNRKHFDGWRFKKSNEQWLKLDDNINEMSTEREVVGRCIVSGEKYIFRSINEASRISNIVSGTIRSHCEFKAKTPVKGWNFRFLSDFTNWPEYSEQELAIFKEYPLNPKDGIEVYDLETNSTMFFTSSENAGKHFDLSPVTINKLARYEGIRKNRFKFKLVRVRKTF